MFKKLIDLVEENPALLDSYELAMHNEKQVSTVTGWLEGLTEAELLGQLDSAKELRFWLKQQVFLEVYSVKTTTSQFVKSTKGLHIPLTTLLYMVSVVYDLIRKKYNAKRASNERLLTLCNTGKMCECIEVKDVNFSEFDLSIVHTYRVYLQSKLSVSCL